MSQRVIPLTQTKARFSRVVAQAARRGTRTIVTRRGRPVAAIVPVQDLETLEEVEDREAEAALRKDLDRKACYGAKAVPLDKVLRPCTPSLARRLPVRSVVARRDQSRRVGGDY